MSRKSTDERRAEISTALLRTMAEHGYTNASIKRIAEEADVTPGLIHYHFDKKQEILLYLLDELVDRQLELLEARLESTSSPIEALETTLDTFLAVGEAARPDEVAAWVTITAEAIRQPEVRDALSSALGEFRRIFVDIIERGIDAGAFDPEDRSPEACAAALLSTIQGYFSAASLDDDLVPEGSAAGATRAMARGLLQTDDDFER